MEGWLAMKASHRPQQAGDRKAGLHPPKPGRRPCCKLRGPEARASGPVLPATREKRSLPRRSALPATHWCAARPRCALRPPRPGGSARLADGPRQQGGQRSLCGGRVWERHLHAKCFPPILVLACLVSISFRQRLSSTLCF